MDITGIDLSPRLERLRLNIDDSTIYELLAQPNDHEDASITPENERYCAGGGRARSIKLLEI
jgi:hypothetical protein